jgi:hypothetical protein
MLLARRKTSTEDENDDEGRGRLGGRDTPHLAPGPGKDPVVLSAESVGILVGNAN